ncbi:hypothetical protein [Phenylobacterium sp.]|uniref:hypothetical protein n=1 Tax=Phenylobacterium sp. TaxID=1871053 RepID=UPI003BACD2F6
MFADGTRYEINDLINEAVLRALDGNRRCPRKTAPVIFLANAMRSIVSAERASVALHPRTQSLSATGTEGPFNVRSLDRNPEEMRLARDEFVERLQALDTLFADDEEAQMIIMADIDGLDADAIRELTGLNSTQYATARRRIRRRIEVRFPTGFRT